MSAPTFKVEKGIPIPVARNVAKYPYEGMEIGDSFFVPNMSRVRMNGSVQHQQYRRGWKFSMRTESNGVRVWRVKK